MTEPEITNKPKRLRRICLYSLAVVALIMIGLWGFAFYRPPFTRKKVLEDL